MKSSKKIKDARVIIIGDTQVGKTTLLTRFIDRQFTAKTTSTISCVFTPCRVETANGTSIPMQIWDTAGQERYQSIGQVFYRNANYAIICFDSTKEDPIPEMEKWAHNVRDVEPECVIYIAATKSDLLPQNAENAIFDKCDDIASKINAAEYFVTSAVTGQNVDSLFTAIAENWLKIIQLNSSQQNISSDTVEINSKEHLKDEENKAVKNSENNQQSCC